MTTSSLQSRLDVVVVGHVDGAGRAVVWRGSGVGKDAAAVRQAAVVPPGHRLATEPGWLLRKLPSGRWCLLAGGTQHPDMVDSFGRTGIFHGAGFVASAADMGVALAAPDATALCLELARLAVDRRMAPSSQLRAAEAAAAKHGPIKAKLIPSRDALTAMPGPTWESVRDILRSRGLRPCTAPVAEGLVWGQPAIEAKKVESAVRIDGADDAARRIIAAWC